MAFTEEQFDALVKQLETIARQQPQTYKFRVGMLALLGYTYIALVLVGLLAVVALLVWLALTSRRINGAILQLGIVVLIMVFLVVRSLFVSFPPPEGLELNRTQTENLFAMVNQLTTQLQALKVHHILLTRDFNASVVQVPRLGILGWYQNYLIVGLPLMQALSVEQFRAVLAHELGHLSGNHSKFNGWIYRVRKTWVQILQSFYHSGNHSGSLLFTPFFNWYTPFFNAYSFVLGRMNEYEADRCAAELAGAKNAAGALVAVEVRSRFLEESYWKSVYQRVKQDIEPPAATYTNLLTALKTDPDPMQAEVWLNQAFSRRTDNADTHPCLSDRLEALGVDPSQREELPFSVETNQSAAEQLLGKFLPEALTRFDEAWKLEVETPWRQRYAYAQEIQQQRQALEAKAETEDLTQEEAWNRVQWTLELEDAALALPLVTKFLATYPDHAAANYTLGQLLLTDQNADGVAHLERAMAKDPMLTLSGCELIYAFLKQQGRLKEAQTYVDRWEQQQKILDRANHERMVVSDRDTFTPHNLTPGTIAPLRQQLQNFPQVKEAYLVQKVVAHLPETPLYVLAIVRKASWSELNSEQANNAFLDQLANELQFPQSGFLIVLATNALRQKIRKVEGSQLL
jgi:Zn-dependent protease with chaperone function